MEKRFQQIGTMQAEIASDCPLKAEEISLWLDAENEVLFLTPKMRSEYQAAVKELIIGYDAVDAEGKIVEKERDYLINDCEEMTPGAVFGEDMPITLQASTAVGGKFYIDEITFEDGYVWCREDREEHAEGEEEEPEEKPDVTMVQTIGGFTQEGPVFRKVPLSKIIAQRLTSQLVTTVIAIVLCVFSLAQYINAAMSSDKELTDALMSTLGSLSGEMDEAKEEELLKTIEDNGYVSMARGVYIAGAVLIGGSILFSLYLIMYLREARHYLRDNEVKDPVLAATVKKLKVLSIVELVLCFVCSFNIFGVFAGFSGLSTASMHKRVMKSKKEKMTKV